MACGSEDVMRQEHDYFRALEKAKAYRVSGAELRLGPAPAAVTLVFRAD
jgi:heat shock protein HslJ